MGKLNIPNSRKIFGFNLAPKLSNGTVRPFENMLIEWDWDGWIKPQIDYCAGNNIGFNAMRLIGGSLGVADAMFTQDYHDSRMLQLADYCQSLDIYMYPTCFGKSAYAATLPTLERAIDITSTTLRKLQQYPNMVGVDVVQEANPGSVPSDATIASLLNGLRSYGVTLPLTCSTSEQSLSSAATAPWIYANAVNFDYIDIHSYTYPITLQSFDPLLAAFPDKDILIGEYGRDQSVAEANRVVDLRQVLDLANSGNPRIRGGLWWAATDQDTVSSNQWGLYPTTFTLRSQDTQLLLRRYTGGSVAKCNAVR